MASDYLASPKAFFRVRRVRTVYLGEIDLIGGEIDLIGGEIHFIGGIQMPNPLHRRLFCHSVAHRPTRGTIGIKVYQCHLLKA